MSAEMPGRIREMKDEWGNVQRFWIQWLPVDDIAAAGPDDRVYHIDRMTGEITFGDGRRGRIPPSGGADAIQVKYRIGGGAKGNVLPSEIVSIQNSIAFVDGVYNPTPSGAGCDVEPFVEAVERESQKLKHRNRAVTAGDFEWLCREASQNIAKVKCLPNYNPRGEKESSSVTVVVLPKGGDNGLQYFPELKKRVEKYLRERTANTMIAPGKISVIPPAMIEISVRADLNVNDMDSLAWAEKEALDKINQFLSPLTGGYNGTGWEIGQYPHISTFYTLLKSVTGVNYVEQVALTVFQLTDGDRKEIDPGLLATLPHGMVTNGRHLVTVKV
jgi:predicted phage baseplate assembly protein